MALHRGLVRQLRKKKAFEEIIEGPAGRPAVAGPLASSDGSGARQKRAVLTSTIVLYSKGSRAARFLVRMGAGAARTRMQFVVKDLETHEELPRSLREGTYAGWLRPDRRQHEEDHGISRRRG